MLRWHPGTCAGRWHCELREYETEQEGRSSPPGHTGRRSRCWQPCEREGRCHALEFPVRPQFVSSSGIWKMPGQTRENLFSVLLEKEEKHEREQSLSFSDTCLTVLLRDREGFTDLTDQRCGPAFQDQYFKSLSIAEAGPLLCTTAWCPLSCVLYPV